MERVLHSREEAAAALGISTKTLGRWVALRHLHPRRIGRRVMFEAREIQRFASRDHLLPVSEKPFLVRGPVQGNAQGREASA